MRIRSILLAVTMSLLLLGLTSAGLAQSDIGFKGIGGRLGYVDPEGSWDGTISFGVVADLGTFVRQLHWDAAITYWASSQDYKYPPYGSYSWSISDFAIRSGVKYPFIEGPWEPYAGGGLGLHFFSWDNKWHGYSHDADETDFGLYIVGGVEHRFNTRWKGSAELQLDFADWDQTNVQINLIHILGK